MILRVLPITLWCVVAGALSPLPPLDDDCALYLSGPGRTSAYDYTLNLLRGKVGFEGQQTCITYDAINQAYIEARKRILVAQPKGDWKPEDYASVGELVLDISINIARTYGLTYEEIEKALPLIDTSRTLISEVCPPVFSHVECRAGKYRRLDGLCNNLQHPTWGSTNVPFQRLIGPLFADGINAPRISHTGHDLPLSRVVSRTIHTDEGYHDHAGTVMVIAWGQFMDHDLTLTATPLDPRSRNDPEECCKRLPHQKHPYCNEIRIPEDDYFFRLFGVKCMDFVRAFPSPRPGCRLGSRVPFNTLTGAIDGNTVYGVTDKFARKLRTGYGGLLRMNDVFKEYGLRDLLPLKLDIPDEGCTRPNKNMYCFEAGEIRVNEQLVLTVMHTLMAREHNRVAKGLAEVNPHWDDETLYQEARRINIAEIQHITYNEFLPILLGKDVMDKFGLVLEKEGYWNGYDPEVNPDVIDAFSAAAFRFGHSLLPTAVERWSKAHKFIASKRLSDLIRRPYDLYRAGVLDEYIMGLMNQVAQAMDDSITQEVTNHLFKKIGARFGMDLVSLNMQRGREFGIPGYMEFRKFCGLPGANSFQDLFGSMPNATVTKYQSIFEHPIDVDLWSGGVSERPLPGSMLGATFACVIATQFSYARRGDRFWYELPHQPSSFTPEQLQEVRKARLARVICDNTDIIDTVQLYPMVLPDHELNPRVPCRSGIIPSMDFSKWAEPPPHVGAKQFVTEAIAAQHNLDKAYEDTDNSTGEVCEDVTSATPIFVAREPEIKESENCTAEPTQTDASDKNEFSIVLTHNNDTVLKYVYKHENDDSLRKNAGNPKNSLKRRKRSLNNIHENQTKPLIINYESHFQGHDDLPLHHDSNSHEVSLLPQPSNTFIKKADLASFNIRTLHDNTYNTDNPNNASPEERGRTDPHNDPNNSQDETQEINESSGSNENTAENFKSADNPHFYKLTFDSKQKLKLTKPKSNHDSDDSKNHSNIKGSNEQSSSDSNESDSQSATEQHSKENQSEENSSKPTAIKQNEAIFNSNEPIQSKENSPGSFESHGSSESLEARSKNTDEVSDETKEGTKEELKFQGHEIPNDHPNDFSYERIKLNEDGQVVADEDQADNIHEPKDGNRHVLHKPNINNYKASDYTYHKKVNEGEIKPVVEINRESSETQKSEENDNKSYANGDAPSNEAFEDVSVTKSQEKSDYNINRDIERVDPQNVTSIQENQQPQEGENQDVAAEQVNDDDGKPFIIPENHIPYDDNLYYKFGDSKVVLPEIVFPEDILAFNYETPPSRGKSKHNRYVAEQEDKDNDSQSNEDNRDQDSTKENATKRRPKSEHVEEVSREEESGEDDSREGDGQEDDTKSDKQEGNESSQKEDHQSYEDEQDRDKVDHRNASDNHDEEDDEDLYEKFVRERFGKKDTFAKRAEKLQQNRFRSVNPKLRETIDKVISQAGNTEIQAAKSKDPNAGYLWTLEYGEKY